MESILKEMNAFLRLHNISSAQLAMKCGWNEKRLTSMLNGSMSINSADYGTICNALDVRPSWFYLRSKNRTGQLAEYRI